MEISEIGVNPTYTNNPAAVNQNTDKATPVDKTKLLELLGPAVTENYSDLIVSVSENNNRIHDFIDKVNKRVDLYA